MDWWRETIDTTLWFELGFRVYAWLMWSDWEDVVAAWVHHPHAPRPGQW